MRKPAVLFAVGVVAMAFVACSDECVKQADGTCAVLTDGGTVPVTPDGGTPLPDAGVAGFEPYGTTPSGGHVSLDCTPGQVPAFTDHDCLYSHLQLPESVACTLKLADRLGVAVAVPTTVSFKAEAGVISPAVVSDVTGHANGYLEVYGGVLPADVAPMAGEQSLTVDFGCGPRTGNPRDGYVTVIAWVRGEEGFVDLNQNGKYDEGEPFVDEGEPFVDANDNGKWDPGEWFLDVNGDGKYTGPNGKWDADTIIWSQTRVVYTGLPAFLRDASNNEFLSRIYDSGLPPAATPPPTPFALKVDGPAADYGVFFTDSLLNPLDPSAAYGAGSENGNVTVELKGPSLPFRQPPELFRLLYCDAPQYPATCYDGPVESGCRSSPCYIVPEVALCLTANCRGFEYGNFGVLVIKPSKAGADAVTVSATVADITVTFPSLIGQVTP